MIDMSVIAAGAPPPILHQTWKSEVIPSCWALFHQSWRTHHPDWEHRVLTDDDLRQLVRQHYSWFLPIYDAYSQPIMRVDAARYFLLHRHGGLYVDLDFESLRPIDPLLSGCEVVLGCEPPAHVGLDAPRARGLDRIICNALMASTPGHPFWEHVFELLIAYHRSPDPLDATGPFLLTRAVASYAEPSRVTIVPWDLLYPSAIPESVFGQQLPSASEARERAFGIHHWAGSWWRHPLLADNGATGDP